MLVARLLPSRCAVCGEDAGATLVCIQCMSRLVRLPLQHCPVCAEPRSAADDSAALPCGRCLRQPPAYDATFASFVYGAPLDRLVVDFKFRSRLANAEFFAAQLPPPPNGLAAVLPVPLAKSRLAERGYNQAFELAKTYARRYQLPFAPHLLQRTRATPHQIGLPWHERARNLRDAFACTRPLAGGHYMVVDDVMTSGATLQEIACTLKAAGASRVTNLVIARAAREGVQT